MEACAMRRWIWGAALAALLAGAAAAQVSVDPAHPRAIADILSWRGETQSDGYRSIEKIFKTVVVRRGDHVHPLPRAAKPIAPSWDQGGKHWTVESYMAAYRVSGLLVLKDGQIVLEKYGLGRKPTERWTSFSVAKSLTSTLVGAAIQDGKIKSIDDPITRYVPELKGSAYEGVSVRQMLMMSSGVKWNEDYVDPKSDVALAGQKVEEPGVDPMVSYLKRLPRAHPPGSTFHYNTGETDLVAVLVAKATGEPMSRYASEKIWKPYGMEQDAVWMTDPGGVERGGCCVSMTLRDFGRLGQFVLDGGVANGKPVVPPWWTKEATRRQIATDDKNAPPGSGYGWFWWIRGPDEYDAIGIFGQAIATFPKERVVIVQNAAWPAAGSRELSAARAAMLQAVKAAASR
jgi:CubicO group peptidase (beta-lactamase class C family)